MISLFLFNAASSCDSVYLNSSFGDPTFSAITVRPLGSCWSDNGFGINSDMFVCGEDGNLKYLQWDTLDCADNNETEASFVNNNVTIGFATTASVSAEQVVANWTCGSSTYGVPCEITMFSYSSELCENSAISYNTYRPGCSWIATETYAKFECCSNGGLKLTDYGDTSHACSTSAQFELTFTEPFQSCTDLNGMFYNYNFQWAACSHVDESELVDCPTGAATSNMFRKVIIAIGILFSISVVLGALYWCWNRSAFRRYKALNADQRAEVLNQQSDDKKGNKDEGGSSKSLDEFY